MLGHGPGLFLWVFTVWVWARGQCKGRTLKTVNSLSSFSRAKVEFLTWPTPAIDILINLWNKKVKSNTNSCVSGVSFLPYHTEKLATQSIIWHILTGTHSCACSPHLLCWSPQNVYTISSNCSPLLSLPSLFFKIWIQTGAKLSQQLLHPLQTRPVFLELAVGKASASGGSPRDLYERHTREKKKKGWDSQIGKRRIGERKEWGEIPPVHYNEETIQLASLYGPWCWLPQTGQQVPSFYWLKPRGAQPWDTWKGLVRRWRPF